MTPYKELPQGKSFQKPLLFVIFAQSSLFPESLGSPLFHFLVEPSAHVALLGRQLPDGALQIVSVKLLSPAIFLKAKINYE